MNAIQRRLGARRRSRRRTIKRHEAPVILRDGESAKPIPCTDGRFVATTDGRIINVRTKGEIRGTISSKGYRETKLVLQGERRHFKFHRLIAMAFHGMPTDEKPQVNHINGVKDDNRPSNLEWVSGQENVEHAAKLGLVRRVEKEYGPRRPSRKLSDSDVREIRALRETRSLKEIAITYGVSLSCVSMVARKQRFGNL